MDRWQYNQTRLLKRRIDDLTTVIFAFIAYEFGGLITATIFLLLEVATRIYQAYKEKKKFLGANDSDPGEAVSYRNYM